MSRLSQQENWVKAFQRIRRSIEKGQADDHTAATRFVDRSVWGASAPVYLTTHNGPGTMSMTGVYNYTRFDEGTYS